MHFVHVWVILIYFKPLFTFKSQDTFTHLQHFFYSRKTNTVKLGNKERFDMEQIGIKEPIPVTNLPFTS